MSPLTRTRAASRRSRAFVVTLLGALCAAGCGTDDWTYRPRNPVDADVPTADLGHTPRDDASTPRDVTETDGAPPDTDGTPPDTDASTPLDAPSPTDNGVPDDLPASSGARVYGLGFSTTAAPVSTGSARLSRLGFTGGVRRCVANVCVTGGFLR